MQRIAAQKPEIRTPGKRAVAVMHGKHRARQKQTLFYGHRSTSRRYAFAVAFRHQIDEMLFGRPTVTKPLPGSNRSAVDKWYCEFSALTFTQMFN
jgi:hypothetical protein